MTIEELAGDYVIEGHNQDQQQSTYKGELNLSLDKHRRIIAKWTIAGDQKQQGKGFFKDNILVINFQYHNELNELFKGVVVYKCLTQDILVGFWSEELGNPLFIGTERAYRKSTQTHILQ